MYFPVRHEARAALALDDNQAGAALERRQIGGSNDDDPIASIFSEIFGGGGDDTPTTSTRRTTTTARTTTNAIVTPTPIVITPSSHTTTTRTTSTRPLTTAQVDTSVPPRVSTPVQVTITSTAANSGNTGVNDASSSNSSSKSGLPSVVVGIIVAASVIFGLIFLALIARKIFQARRRRNRRNTWAATGLSPFEPPVTQEKALPPPPPVPAKDNEYASYPAYPPAALSYAQPQQPYSPAAPSSAGYPAPYPFGGSGNVRNTTTAGLFNSNAYAPADLAGAAPVVIQQTPPTPLTATAPTGTLSVVKRTFVPSLPDELPIATGDQVRVISSYDDGWALCEKVSTGERGVVPQECLEELKPTNSNVPAGQLTTSNDAVTRLNRASSLKRDKGQTY